VAQAGFEQAVLDKAAAPVVLQNAVAKASAAEQAVKTTQSRATGLASEKATLAKSLADARASQKTLEVAAAALKTELDQAQAASNAAAKSAGAAKQTADAAVAALNAAKAEVELLAVEKQQLDATRSASATTASKGS
jgi:chromosome segregation ATPase